MKLEVKIIKEIRFNDFVKCFKNVVGAVDGDQMVSYKGSRSIAAISRFLCCKMAHPRSIDLFYNTSDAAYKNYYNGTNTHKLMEKLCSERESSQFVNFIGDLSEDRLETLQKNFSPYIEGLEKMDDPGDIADAVTYLFNDLIMRTSEQPVPPPEGVSLDKASEDTDFLDENSGEIDKALVNLAMVKRQTGEEAARCVVDNLKEASAHAMEQGKPGDILKRIKTDEPMQGKDVNDFIHGVIDGMNQYVRLISEPDWPFESEEDSDIVISPKEAAMARFNRVQKAMNSAKGMLEEYLEAADEK